MQQRHHLLRLRKGGCRQRPPSILGFGRSCSSIVVLTTSPLNIWELQFPIIFCDLAKKIEQIKPTQVSLLWP